ncbi:MAG TPA: helix-turn-helix transcriptional regulator [Acidimicrobiales bacterium]
MSKSKRGRTQAEELGNRVRSAREDARLSQETLGEKAGMHRTYIGHLERGEVNPTLYSIVVVAHALGRDPGEFVAGIQP